MEECRLLKDSLLLWIKVTKTPVLDIVFMQLNSIIVITNQKRNENENRWIVDENSQKDIPYI